jgi:hypothetical protein
MSKPEIKDAEIVVFRVSQYIGNKTYQIEAAISKDFLDEERKFIDGVLNRWASTMPTAATVPPATGAPAQGTAKPATAAVPAPAGTVAAVKKALGDYVDKLNVVDKGDYIVVSPKEFLGSENFATVASIVRGLGGEYISAGRDSHFRVYKK